MQAFRPQHLPTVFFFFFFNICLGPSGLSHGMQDLQCIVTDLLLWPGLGTAREILVPQPGI